MHTANQQSTCSRPHSECCYLSSPNHLLQQTVSDNWVFTGCRVPWRRRRRRKWRRSRTTRRSSSVYCLMSSSPCTRTTQVLQQQQQHWYKKLFVWAETKTLCLSSCCQKTAPVWTTTPRVPQQQPSLQVDRPCRSWVPPPSVPRPLWCLWRLSRESSHRYSRVHLAVLELSVWSHSLPQLFPRSHDLTTRSL